MVPVFTAFSASVRRHLALALSLTALAGAGALAQTPVVLPNTISTIAGNTPTATTVGAACPTNPQFTATTANGDGCPAVNAVFGGNERSMTVDPQGNIYTIADSSNPQVVRRIDARTGNISIYAGATAGNSCSTAVTVLGTSYTQTDKLGDGCPVSFSGGFNGGRGMGSDSYGNIFIEATGDYVVHLVCNVVSPLCTAAQVRVNLMRNIAGCTLTTTGFGTSVSGSTVGTAGDGTNAVQLGGSSCTVGLNQPRNAVGDKWGNVYFNDTSNSRLRVILGAASVNGITNPLYAAELLFTATNTALAAPTQGFIYPIAGGASSSTGNAYAVCAGMTDSGGDGCPFYQTLIGSTTYAQGEAVTPEGDLLFTDGLGNLRVIYLGGASVKSALVANGIASPQIGYSYALIGSASASTNLYYNSALTGTYLGKTVKLQVSATQRIATDSVGNVYIGDQAQVLFYDIYTGYVRRLGGGTTAVSCNSTSLGEGCPIAQSLFGAANSVLSVALDNLGNLYIQDLFNKTIHRVSAATLPQAAVNSAVSAPTVLHSPAAATAATVTTAPSTEFAITQPTCAAANTDGSVDCTAPVSFTPRLLSQQNDFFSYTINGTTRTSQLNANVTGTALVFDTAVTPATAVLGASTTGSTAVVMDGNGNAYVSGDQGISKISATGNVSLVTATAASFIAVDAQANVYATAGNTTSITKYVFNGSTYAAASTVAIPSVPIGGTATQGYSGPLTVDANGVIYLADLTNKQVIKLSQATGQGFLVTQTALTAPTSIAQDSYGNLLVLDGTTLFKIPANGFPITAASPVANPAVAVTLTAPTAIAADQGENLYIADSGNIIALPYSGSQYTIPNITGTGVAVDGAGNLYLTKRSVAGLAQVRRNAESNAFGADVSTAYVGIFLNAGATASTGFSQTDTGGNFSFGTPATPLSAGATCNIASTALAGGAACNTSIKFAPTATGSGTVPDVITLLPAVNTIGSFALSGIKNGSTATTSTAITGNTTGLVYSTSTETTFTVTVTQSSGQPAGTVTVSIDGGTAVTYTLTTATATTATASVPVAGLNATTHTIVATYGGSSGIAGSTSPTTTFSIAQASTAVTWTPSTTTQQVSAAIGTGVLDATSGGVSGYYVYTATPSSGPAVSINAASYLPIGTYSLSVQFVPTDQTDYTSSAATVPAFTVSQASTTAALGTSQFLVATDGSGNYTSVQNAINAMPATGGSIYIKPGTYNGFVTVAYPNVSLRGLGGDPTAVVLSNYAGAYSSPALTNTQINGNNNSQGDQGSATLVVAKTTAPNGTQPTPNNFYAGNLTLLNTYNTDNTIQNNLSTNSGSCAITSPTSTNQTLYNAGKLCYSQALAIWITADQAVMNNVYTTSLQDTIYNGSQGCGSTCVAARQYWWRGKVTGDVDYIFGDSASVFDRTSIYTTFHGTTATGTETIEAQNKQRLTGSGTDYLSGDIMNSDIFTSQAPGMTNLYYGRPYGAYSTYIMLNSAVDQVAPVGYIEFSGLSNLPSSTYAEFNTTPYTDPATGSPDANGVLYFGTGGSTGSGITGARETTSQNPGTILANNSPTTQLSAAQATFYYPTAFLGATVPANTSYVAATPSTYINTFTANWNPTTALGAQLNAFVPSASVTTVDQGSNVTVLMRPQTPGGGILPTGTYTLFDGGLQIASGSLDAAGEASYSSKSLAAGAHSFTWTYGGDANFAGSATGTPLNVTVAAGQQATTTTLSVAANNTSVIYGTAVNVTAVVAATNGNGGGGATGTVTLTIDGASTNTMVSGTLVAGSYTFAVSGLAAGTHTYAASYAGDANNAASTTSANITSTITKASLTVVGAGTTRAFDTPNVLGFTVVGLVYADTAASTFTGAPALSTTALRNSPAGSYPVAATTGTLALSTAAANNYSTPAFANGTITVTGGVPQSIVFDALPNFPSGNSYQLTATASSGLGLTYTVASGSATIVGTKLTITGAGPVMITASQPGNSNYAAATSVSQSFTAQ